MRIAAMPELKSKHRNSPPTQQSRADTYEYLCNLIRDLLWVTHSCAEYAPTFISHNSAERVVLDIEFEGDRYVLIRVPRAKQKAASLSPREKEIVLMVAQGRQNKVIAAELKISLWTVCTHMRRVFAKIGVTSRASMVAELSDLIAPAKLRNHLDISFNGDVINSNEPVQGAQGYQLQITSKKQPNRMQCASRPGSSHSNAGSPLGETKISVSGAHKRAVKNSI